MGYHATKGPSRIAAQHVALCPRCGKRCFSDRNMARRAGRSSFPGTHIKAYRCGKWFHFTSELDPGNRNWVPHYEVKVDGEVLYTTDGHKDGVLGGARERAAQLSLSGKRVEVRYRGKMREAQDMLVAMFRDGREMREGEMKERDESFVEQALNEAYEKAEREDAVPWNDADEDFPVTCANGCPEGYLGKHKFSCVQARFHEALEHPDAETQARLDREWEETFGDPHGEA